MSTPTAPPRPVAALATAAVVLALAGCGGQADPPASAPAPDLPRGSDPVELDPAGFTAGSDHRYFPLEPGRQWVYRETAPGGPPLRVVVTVTSQTRRIANGVEARVVRDTVTEHGEVVEDTFDWYAQDADGNVWYLGEDTAEFEDGRVTTREGSFEAGVDGALPGLIMPAEPEVGAHYRQEYAEGEAEDEGAVLALDQQAQVDAGPLHRRAAHGRHHPPRAPGAGVQALRARRGPGPHPRRLRRRRARGAARQPHGDRRRGPGRRHRPRSASPTPEPAGAIPCSDDRP